MELVINDKTYSLNFGMRFLRDINKKIETPIEFGSAVKQQIGLKYYVSLLLDDDVAALSTVLITANAGQKPNLTQAIIDSYFDNEETNLDELFDSVMEGLETANATKKIVLQLKKAVEVAEANQEQ
nr:MAG TPA: tail assembly chaperone [Caudoviricetes sp.]